MKLNFQYAHHDHSEFEERPCEGAEDALAAFDAFDWHGEAVKANELQKCAPTLAVIRSTDEAVIWVSAYQTDSSLRFVSECRYPGEVSAWFGLVKKPGIVNLGHQTMTPEQARQALRGFLDRDEDALQRLYG
ncbi:hypothetical protein [Ferrimonas balearica]|uniref:hypothetical protein n=1 Tax=Ferrimonas balearica TaxID=44012 RepID=UPI001C995060|nr:hypothetical protein [Ferrimonas balearica]MBY5991125.1 hypothetical protein [Ferrimonas balearica]